MSDKRFIYTLTLGGIESDWEIWVTKTDLEPLGWRVDMFEGTDENDKTIFVDKAHEMWNSAMSDFRRTPVFDIIDECMR